MTLKETPKPEENQGPQNTFFSKVLNTEFNTEDIQKLINLKADPKPTDAELIAQREELGPEG